MRKKQEKILIYTKIIIIIVYKKVYSYPKQDYKAEDKKWSIPCSNSQLHYPSDRPLALKPCPTLGCPASRCPNPASPSPCLHLVWLFSSPLLLHLPSPLVFPCGHRRQLVSVRRCFILCIITPSLLSHEYLTSLGGISGSCKFLLASLSSFCGNFHSYKPFILRSLPLFGVWDCVIFSVLYFLFILHHWLCLLLLFSY